MKQDLHDKRKEYSKKSIDFFHLPDNPFVFFADWYELATHSELIHEPYAMSLATIGGDGFPRTRVVLLKEFNEHGFVFFTNFSSTKGKSITVNPKVCLSFFWDGLEQQIIIKGRASKISNEESADYFYKRPVESQIGAIVSAQSSVIPFEEDLEGKVQELKTKYSNERVPKPENWGGYLVRPVEFEFWQGRPSRLHDRLRYRLENEVWVKTRLSP